MNLWTALRLGEAPRVAFVGAGGKTTALFALAREAPRAVVTTTTHLGAWQAALADRVLTPEALDAPLSGVTLVVGGAPTPEDRLPGLPPETLLPLAERLAAAGVPLLIEADGARGRPLKAPADHEPAIPPLEGLTVVVVAGLSALGQPLDARHVHRPRRFAALSGLSRGQPVSVEALAAVLRHPQGGCKGIPADARRVALLTQLTDARRQAQAGRLAEMLGGTFHAVLLSPEAGRVSHVLEPVAGIVLAAGEGTRLGRPKQLLRWRGEPLVRRAARAALLAGLEPVVVVTGAAREAVQQAVRDLPVQPVHNADWPSGQGSSVRAGVQALPAAVGAAIFLLADQPFVPPTLLRALVAEHRRTLAPIVAPQVGGRRATPVLFDRVTFPDLCALQGDVGGRALFARFPLRYLPWLDERLRLDVDTPADWERLRDEG